MRARQLALLLLLLALGVSTLGFVASQSEPPILTPSTEARAPHALDLTGPPEIDRTAEVAPAPAPTPAPAPAPAPTPAPTAAPAPAPDLGRCAEPRFREIATQVVTSCAQACKKDDSPLVALSQHELESLFGRPDDAGVASHFAVFGCNRYAAGGQTCRGFDSASADPATCPASSPSCQQYASVLKDELRAFLDRNKTAHTILLFGTASPSGNDTSAMSEANAKLAEERALAVGEVVHQWRREVGGAAKDLRVFSVVLDNTRTDWWQTKGFHDVLQTQLQKLGNRTDRGFEPLAADAANRSVMVVAISCPLAATP